MAEPLVVGIDLGTTYSLAAVMHGRSPCVVPNSLGEVLTPSAVGVDEKGQILVGAAAKARATRAPHLTATAFKRDMGTRRVFALGSHKFRAEELSALVLKTIKTDVEARMGCAINEAVVTVPAYFGELQRRATRNAAEIAGLRVERIINEPTAAALAYGLHNLDSEARVAVLDLGGGTFDVTILEIMEGVIEIQGSAGDARLGGEDFVDLMVRQASVAIEERYGLRPSDHPEAASRLAAACELAKRRLSSQLETSIVVPQMPTGRGRSIDVELSISRADVESWWLPLLNRLRGPIRTALGDAGLAPSDVAKVILVGGSTRIPIVGRLAAEIFGRFAQCSVPVDEAVAMGAAVQSALKAGHAEVEDLVATDIAPFSLGIDVLEQSGRFHVSDVFSPIIDRGTVLPASRVQRYCTSVLGQTQIEFGVYQGEHSLCSKNQRIGGLSIRGIPKNLRALEDVEVRFSYDLNGLLEVEATVCATGKTTSAVIDNTAGGLSAAEIKQARKAMQRLKVHPREALPNTTALERAEALHIELLGDAREHLQRHIVAFRSALERQLPQEIKELRDALNQVVSAMRGQRSSDL